jgi:hypothetical protein
MAVGRQYRPPHHQAAEEQAGHIEQPTGCGGIRRPAEGVTRSGRIGERHHRSGQQPEEPAGARVGRCGQRQPRRDAQQEDRRHDEGVEDPLCGVHREQVPRPERADRPVGGHPEHDETGNEPRRLSPPERTLTLRGVSRSQPPHGNDKRRTDPQHEEPHPRIRLPGPGPRHVARRAPPGHGARLTAPLRTPAPAP